MIGLPTYQRRQSLKALAAQQSTRFRGIADNDLGRVALLFAYETESNAVYFTTGYFDCIRQAVEYSRLVFLNEDIEMNIFKNTKLFPNIKGVMLKDKRITLHLSGKYNIVEMREDANARIELYFTDHEKTAIINSNQLLIIGDIYGPETSEWKDKPVVLFGEEGYWFGKNQWGIRVDEKLTKAAAKKAKVNGSTKTNGKAPAVPDDIPFDNEDVDPDDLALAELIMGDGEQADLFAD